MARKLALIFAVLALSFMAQAAVNTNTPSTAAFTVAPGKVFTNGTDTAFTNMTGCWYTSGFVNTTNFVWCQTATVTGTAVYTYQRRAINASSPGTVNSTLDTKIATTHVAPIVGGVVECTGQGYFGIASATGTGAAANLIFSYIAVNGSSATKVTLTSNTDMAVNIVPQECMFNANIFYIIYTQYVSAGNQTQNGVYIHAVNVTSGAAFYNSTGGVKILSPTSQSLVDGDSTLSFASFMGTNVTGSSTTALLLYSDSSAAISNVGSKYNVLPITLSTGAAGSVSTLATGATSVVTVATATVTPRGTSLSTYSTSTTYTTSTTNTAVTTTSVNTAATTTSINTAVTTTGTTVITTTITSDTFTITNTITSTTTNTAVTTTSTNTAATTTSTDTAVTTSSTFTTSGMITLTSTVTTAASTTTVTAVTSTMVTSYSLAGGFGSLASYGVALTQNIVTTEPTVQLLSSTVYSNAFYVNGSTTASSTMNLTNPAGYYLAGSMGYGNSMGFALFNYYYPSTGSSMALLVNKDTYYTNGTLIASTSTGTYESPPQVFNDAINSIWYGYTATDSALTPNVVAGYAGQVVYNPSSSAANTLTTIFAFLALMIAALFAF